MTAEHPDLQQPAGLRSPASGPDWMQTPAGYHVPAAPEAPRRRRRWLIPVIAAAALVAGAVGAYAAATSQHHPAKPRPAASAPAAPTPDQILARDGYTAVGQMTKAELLNQAPSADLAQILAPLVNGTTVIGQNSTGGGEVVIPITPAGKTVMDNPAMLRRVAAGSGGSTAATARFAGPYLVITDPQAATSGGSTPSPSASSTGTVTQ